MPKAIRQQAKPLNRIRTKPSSINSGPQGPPSRDEPESWRGPDPASSSCLALAFSSRSRIGSRNRDNISSTSGTGASNSRPFCQPPNSSSSDAAATIKSGSRITPARAGPALICGRNTRTRSTRCQMPPGRYLSRLLRTNKATTAIPSGRWPNQRSSCLHANALIRMLAPVRSRPRNNQHQPVASRWIRRNCSPCWASATPMKLRLASVIRCLGLGSRGITSSRTLTSQTPRPPRPAAIHPRHSHWPR